MMKITAIKPASRNVQRATVKVNGKPIVTLSQNLVAELGLFGIGVPAELGGAGMDAPKSPKDSSFAELIGKVADDAMQSGKTAEAMTAKAVVGEAD